MFGKETLTKLADRFWSPDSQRTIKPHLLAATQPDKGGDEGGGRGEKDHGMPENFNLAPITTPSFSDAPIWQWSVSARLRERLIMNG